MATARQGSSIAYQGCSIASGLGLAHSLRQGRSNVYVRVAPLQPYHPQERLVTAHCLRLWTPLPTGFI